MQCPVGGCDRQLDEHGLPVEYCDYQQGRCPMYKQKIDFVGIATVVVMLVLTGTVLWLSWMTAQA